MWIQIIYSYITHYDMESAARTKTYIIQIFGIGCDPKPNFDLSTLDNFAPRNIVEHQDPNYVPTELEEVVFRGVFALDVLHRDFRLCPVSFTAAFEECDLDVLTKFLDRSDSSDATLSATLYETAIEVFRDKMAYNDMCCIYAICIDSDVRPGSKVNRYTCNVQTYDIHFTVLELCKEMTYIDRKLVQTILKKRTVLSEYYEKFYVCMSVKQASVLDFVNTFDREADNVATNIDPSRAVEYVDALRKEISTLDGGVVKQVESVGGVLAVRADTHFLIFGSSGSEHLAECSSVLKDSMSRMGYT